MHCLFSDGTSFLCIWLFSDWKLWFCHIYKKAAWLKKKFWVTEDTFFCFLFSFFFNTGVIPVLLLVSNDADVLKIPPPPPPFNNLYFPWFRRFSNFPVTKYFFPSSESYFPVACVIICLIWHNTLLLLICSFENFVHLSVENHLSTVVIGCKCL